ncbi:hypothetical protein SASPL_128040 [Salvia splendens]|uniref:TolB protein n=1 Tax=Salvia splendens TaxID=180675 RepID=A0A8X8XEC8_SALSN|nr:uncharacterized protein LOC121750707 [Salvia splendens]KAG6409996.1 hypothetical protein SASPL_128040 [Salvia splendens]
MSPTGTIVFSTVGRANYGFDIFSVQLNGSTDFSERRLTDGASINFNGSFLDDDNTIVYISERTGSAQIFLNRGGADAHPEPLPSAAGSLFHDRPAVNNRRLYFISAHERPEKLFTSWCALYSAGIDDEKVERLTPYGSVDFSPAVSPSGKLIAVASYGDRRWGGEFHDLRTEVVVFSESNPAKRFLVSNHGGWPTWCGDSTLYFHRQSDDGWWSIFRADLPSDFSHDYEFSAAPCRVTPPGIHCFTPAAVPDSAKIAFATRRKGKHHRHIEIFDTELQKFQPVTELINPDFHHYNPFVSPGGSFLGYHRFRGSGGAGTTTIPHLDPISSPLEGLRMFRINGSFPAFSSSGDFIALNGDFDQNSGLRILRSDGTKRWNLFKNRTTFSNCWNPADENVIFVSIGPVFESVTANVHIARVTFNRSDLTNDRDEIAADIKILTEEGTGNNAFPSCSPDGKSVVFRSGRDGHKNLYIIDAGAGESAGIRRLTDGAWIDTMPSWSPDGETIAFSSNRHRPDDPSVFGIYIARADGSEVRRVEVAGFEEERERLNHVCFSADMEWLLFTANLGGVTAETVALPNQFQPYGDLYVVRLDGSGLQRLTCNAYENGVPTWHPKVLRDEIDLSRLSLVGENGDDLKGKFIEPLWIKCDI